MPKLGWGNDPTRVLPQLRYFHRVTKVQGLKMAKTRTDSKVTVKSITGQMFTIKDGDAVLHKVTKKF